MFIKKKKEISIVLVVAIIMSMLVIAFTNVSASVIESYPLGDADMDFNVTVKDVTEIQMHIAKYTTFDDKQMRIADCDEIQGIQITDATYIQMYLSGMNVDYPKNSEGLVMGEGFVDFVVSTSMPETFEPTLPDTEPGTIPETTEPATVPTETTAVRIGIIKDLCEGPLDGDYTPIPTNPSNGEFLFNDPSRFKVNYECYSDSMISFGTVDCKYLGYSVMKSVGDYYNRAPQEFYIYEAKIPAWYTSFQLIIDDTFFGSNEFVDGSNAGYFFFYDEDPSNYGYHGFYTNEEFEPSTEPITTEPITTSPVVIEPTTEPATLPTETKKVKVAIASDICEGRYFELPVVPFDPSSDEEDNRFNVAYDGFYNDIYGNGTVSCKSLGYTEQKTVSFIDDLGQEVAYCPLFNIYEAEIPAWYDSFTLVIGDKYFSYLDSVNGANAGYFFFVDKYDPCHYGTHAVYATE